MSKGIRQWVPAALGLAFALWACEAVRAQVIYQDDFSGAGGPLNGTTPDVSATGAAWAAGNTILDNGTIGAAQFTAVLPFQPQPNFVYTLSADLNAVSATPNNNNWLAIGFNQQFPANLNDRVIAASPQPVLWALSRSDMATGANVDSSFLGYAGGTAPTFGGVNHTTVSADRVVITLDTTDLEWKWTVDFNGDGVDVRTETLTSVPNINYVFLSNTSTTLAGSAFDNFSLSAVGSPMNSWNVDGGGNFGSAGNWTQGLPAAGSRVLFGDVLTDGNAPAVVNINIATSLDQIRFANSNSYILEGASTLTLTGSATVATFSGSHEIAARIAGASGLTKAAGGTLVLSNSSNTYTGDTVISAGVLAVTHLGAINQASGVINIAAGATFRLDGDGMGGGPNGNLTEQLTGAGTFQLAPQLTTEVITAGTANPTFDGNILVQGGTLRVTNAAALGTATGGVTVGGNLNEGLLELASVAVTGEVLTLQGRQPTNLAPAVVATGTNSWSGNIVGTAGGNQYSIAVAAAGSLTLTGNITMPDDTSPRILHLSAEAGANGRIEGQIIDRTVALDDGAENANVTVRKTGPGTWTLATPAPGASARDAYHQGETIVEQGTLVVQAGAGDSGELWSRTLDVRSGATLDLSSFGTYSMQALEDPDNVLSSGDETGQTLTGAGTVNLGAGKTLAAFDDSIIAPGDNRTGNGVGTLNITGNLSYSTFTELATGGLNYDLGATTAAGVSDRVVATGSVTINANDTNDQVNVNIRPVGGTLATGTYALIQGSSAGGTASNANYDVRVFDNKGNDITADIHQTFSVSNSANAVNLNVTGASANLTWTGNAGNVWDVSNTSNWSGTGVSQFRQLDNVTFGNVANKNVTINSDVAAGSVTFNGGAGTTYTVSGTGGMTGFGAVNVQSGTVRLNNSGNDYAGTTTIASSARLEMAAASTGSIVANGTLAIAGSTTSTLIDDFNDGNISEYSTYTMLDQTGGGTTIGPPDDVVYSAAGGGITVNGAQAGNPAPEQAIAMRAASLQVGERMVIDAQFSTSNAVESWFGIAVGNSAGFQDLPVGTANDDIRSSYMYAAMTLQPANDGFDSRFVNTTGTLQGAGTTGNIGEVTNLWIMRTGENTYSAGYSKDNMQTTVQMREHTVDWVADSVGFYADIRGTFNPNAGILDNLRLAPTQQPVLQVDGDFTMGTNAVLELDLGYDAFDQLFVSGQATLDGTIAVDFTGSFNPTVGREYTVLTAAGGITDLGVLFDLPTNFTASIVDMTRLVLTYGADILQGDFNDDGVVDAADYIVWRNNLDGDEALLMGNGNGNGVVDIGDYNLWKTNYGMTSGASLAAGAPVPEPATWVLIGLGLASAAICRRSWAR